jgi:hypothetical protein
MKLNGRTTPPNAVREFFSKKSAPGGLLLRASLKDFSLAPRERGEGTGEGKHCMQKTRVSSAYSFVPLFQITPHPFPLGEKGKFIPISRIP